MKTLKLIFKRVPFLRLFILSVLVGIGFILNIFFINADSGNNGYRPIVVNDPNFRNIGNIVPGLTEDQARKIYINNPELYAKHFYDAQFRLGWDFIGEPPSRITDFKAKLYTVISEGMLGNFTKYGFHGTSDVNLNSLLKLGLDNRAGIYYLNPGVMLPGTPVTYAGDVNYAGSFAGITTAKVGGDPIVLRFPLDSLIPATYIGNSQTPIPPTKLEVSYDGVNWRPLSEVVNSSKPTVPSSSAPLIPQQPSILTGVSIVGNIAAKVGVGTMAADYSLGVQNADNKAHYTLGYLAGATVGYMGLKVLAFGTEVIANFGARAGVISGLAAAGAAPIVTTGAVILGTGYGVVSIFQKLRDNNTSLTEKNNIGLDTVNPETLGTFSSRMPSCQGVCYSTLTGKHLKVLTKMVEAEKIYGLFVDKKLTVAQILKLNEEWEILKKELTELDNLRKVATANGIKVPNLNKRFIDLRAGLNSIGAGTAKPFIVVPQQSSSSGTRPPTATPVLTEAGVVTYPILPSTFVVTYRRETSNGVVTETVYNDSGTLISQTIFPAPPPSTNTGGGSSSSGGSSSFQDSSSTTDGQSNGGDTGTRGGY